MNLLNYKSLKYQQQNDIKLIKNRQIKDKKYQIALSMIKGIGGVLFRKLINKFQFAENIFNSNINELIGFPHVNYSIVKEIFEFKYLLNAEYLIKYCNEHEIKIITFYDKEYPEKLRNIYNPPPILYYKGNISFNSTKIISIVGTRKPTIYGKNFLTKLIGELKEEKLYIVSGLASGIDYQVHRESIRNEIENIAVLPCPINEIYPLKHTNLSKKIIEKGALISEYSPIESQEKYYFPARNRIIAGMSDLTIIIEAGKKSGALITAEFANEFNREVFALPGDVGRSKSQGCNNLIRSHKANILTSLDDIKYIMNWQTEKKENILKQNNIKLDYFEEKIMNYLKIIDHKGITLEKLGFEINSKLSNLSSKIMKLEMKNLIQKLPGDKIGIKY
ncbi:MAG: DNA-protecting protein DprA [Bacteroidetes bacterium]|nr:DNA-protecting protein DprA [Bacteroidota bacterium]